MPNSPIQLSSHFLWVRADAYEWRPHDDGDVWIHSVKGAGEQSYRPFEEEGLFRLLADTEPSKDGVMGFVSRYGLVRLLPQSNGDPRSFRWWKRLIIGTRQHVNLWVASRTSDAAVREYRRRELNVARSGSEWAQLLEKLRNRDDAGNLLATMLSRHITGTRLTLVPALPDPKNHFVMEIAPEELMDAIWLQFAEAVAANANYRRCEYCGGYMDSRRHRSDRKTCGDSCRTLKYLRDNATK